MTGALVVIGTLLLAAVVGFALRARDGRVRTLGDSTVPDVLVPDDVRAALDPAAAVTLVQFSTAFCASCRHAGLVLTDLAKGTDGLAHADIDLTDRPELAKAAGVMRTPTTVAVDARGVELLRVGGVPRRDDLLAALRPHLPA